MAKRLNVMARWKEFNPIAEKSMKDDFNSVPSPFVNKIIAYLNNGELVLASSASAIDIFSGERINQTNCILTDGEFSWSNSLGYYVKKYNLQIPKELENKILNS
jgi:hypothetical protein